MMPWPGLIEPFTECFGLGLLGAMCAHHLLLANPILFLLVHTAVWFTFDLLLLKLIEVSVLKVSVKKIQQGWDSNLHVQNTMDKKISTRMGFEPTRAEHNGLAVHRLNHSATLSAYMYSSIMLCICGV